MSRAANGVSRRHGEVAREMWHPLWPERPVDEVPIGYVTNGVHVPTWIGTPMRELLDRHLGEGWMAHARRPRRPGPASTRSPTQELWAARERQRAELVAQVRVPQRRRPAGSRRRPRLRRGRRRRFDPHMLTIGFARRVATYKRLDLLTRDPEWTLSLLGGERPVQVVLAGKAHPRDEDAKRVLKRLFGMKAARDRRARRVPRRLRPGLAAWLVRGCDVWLNLPRPPLEASGTSGMKSAINGGLQLSVLDGWWAEGLRRRQRMGDLRRGRRRPPGPGRARRPRAAPAARRRGGARVLRARRGRPAGSVARHGSARR